MPRITRIQAFQVDLPLHEGSYKWSGGKSVEATLAVASELDLELAMVEVWVTAW